MKKIFSAFFAVLLCSAFIFCGCSSENRAIAKEAKKLNNYTIVANYDDQTKSVVATETFEKTVGEEEGISELFFHLYPTAFSSDAKVLPYTKLNKEECYPEGESFGDIVITNVKVNDNPATYQIAGTDNDILRVELGYKAEKKQKVKVEISFRVTLACSSHRLGYHDDTVNLGNWYPIVCEVVNGEVDQTPYYSTGDPFFSACANYVVTFSYPQKYTLASTGNEVSSKTENGVTTKTFEASVVRDFAMVLGSNYQVLSGKVGKTEVSVYAYNGDESANEYLDYSLKAVEYFNKIFGTYPYKTLKVCFTEFLHGGMEYPNLVMIADKITDKKEIETVIVHEIAHQWWYGLVGDNEIVEAWIDEGLAEYSTVLYLENYYPTENMREKKVTEAQNNYLIYQDVILSLNITMNKKMNLAVNEYKSEYEYVYMVYVKGMLLFNDLRTKVGDDAFFASLKKIQKEYRFKNVTTKEFCESFADFSKTDLEEYFCMWLNGGVEI